MKHSHPVCVSAAWDGFTFECLDIKQPPKAKICSVGSVAPHSKDSTRVAFCILHLTRFHSFLAIVLYASVSVIHIMH